MRTTAGAAKEEDRSESLYPGRVEEPMLVAL